MKSSPIELEMHLNILVVYFGEICPTWRRGDGVVGSSGGGVETGQAQKLFSAIYSRLFITQFYLCFPSPRPRLPRVLTTSEMFLVNLLLLSNF